MFPTREEALKLIRDGLLFNPGPWGKHCLTAAHCAEKIASACGDMDVEKAYILGLLHDIGRKFGVRHLGHVYDGYVYMKSLGYDEAAKICLTHMVDMAEVEKDEVPGNPYRVQEDVEVENTVLDDAVEADVITESKFESVVDDEFETEVETFAETAVTGLKTVGKTAVTNAESVVKTDIDVMAESIESGLQNDEIRKIYYRRRLTVEIWSILPGLSCLTR